MGTPYIEHGVFWYGDPKPAAFPFYWQAAAEAGRSVGLLGVLHTSPRAELAAGSNYRFVMPDLFGDDASTVPSSLEPIQALNLRMTRESARVAQVRPSFRDLSRSAMVPQLTVVAETVQDAEHVQSSMDTWLGHGLDELMIATEGDRRVMTFTCKPACREDAVFLGNGWVDPASVGVTIERITITDRGIHRSEGYIHQISPYVAGRDGCVPVRADDARSTRCSSLPHHRSWSQHEAWIDPPDQQDRPRGHRDQEQAGVLRGHRPSHYGEDPAPSPVVCHGVTTFSFWSPSSSGIGLPETPRSSGEALSADSGGGGGLASVSFVQLPSSRHADSSFVDVPHVHDGFPAVVGADLEPRQRPAQLVMQLHDRIMLITDRLDDVAALVADVEDQDEVGATLVDVVSIR